MKIFERIKRFVGHAARLAELNIRVAVRRLFTSKVPTPQSETLSEIEYYSLLAAEVSRLPNNTLIARQALYDRMWVEVAAQLHDPESEHLAFQKAICKVEIDRNYIRSFVPINYRSAR
jgi:hypothetical protein